MPVCPLQHRVTIGLFQSIIMVDKHCCHIGFLYEFLDFIIVKRFRILRNLLLFF